MEEPLQGRASARTHTAPPEAKRVFESRRFGTSCSRKSFTTDMADKAVPAARKMLREKKNRYAGVNSSA